MPVCLRCAVIHCEVSTEWRYYLVLYWCDSTTQSSRCSIDFVGKWHKEEFQEFEEEEEEEEEMVPPVYTAV